MNEALKEPTNPHHETKAQGTIREAEARAKAYDHAQREVSEIVRRICEGDFSANGEGLEKIADELREMADNYANKWLNAKHIANIIGEAISNEYDPNPYASAETREEIKREALRATETATKAR